jgi:hypothetical protein
MLKEVERMSQLSVEERNLLQSIQEGVAGVKPIDAAWINNIVKAFKKKPSTFKSLLHGRGAMLGECSTSSVVLPSLSQSTPPSLLSLPRRCI